ncbi:hypothetical protein GCM10009832_33060 [Dietzia kunjamensis subsp. schimae]
MQQDAAGVEDGRERHGSGGQRVEHRVDDLVGREPSGPGAALGAADLTLDQLAAQPVDRLGEPGIAEQDVGGRDEATRIGRRRPRPLVRLLGDRPFPFSDRCR